MSDPTDPREEILDWLTSLHLPQYADGFQMAGFQCLKDCRGLTEDRLLELRVFPTGHRRRILRSLEVLGVAVEEQGDEEGEKEGERRGRGQRMPLLKPRHIFMTNKKRVTSCQPSARVEQARREGRQTLPPGAGLGIEETEEEEDTNNSIKRFLRPPRPTPRDPRNIRTTSSASTSTSGSSGEVPSDWEISSEEPSPSSTDLSPGPDHILSGKDQEAFQGEMVANVIYEKGPSFKTPAKGPRPTRSYRLRHRPVPEIPDQVIQPPPDWSVPPLTSTTDLENLPCAKGPSGASCKQKAPLQRTLSPIVPYGETFLYNNPENILDQGTKELFKKEVTEKLKQKKLRKKHGKIKESMNSNKTQVPPHASTVHTVYDNDYTIVEECTANLELSNQPNAATATPEPLLSGPLPGPTLSQVVPMTMVVCDIYSEPFDTLGGLVKNTIPALPADHADNISPYACFYGASKTKLKMGWLDKLSPQGKCVFQKRWVKFDGENLSYYNNDKEMYSKGLIPCGVMKQVQGQGDNRFEVVTSLRTFVFRLEREVERQEWIEALQTAMRSPASISRKPQKCGTNKHGSVELRGYKGRVYVSLMGTRFKLCKSEQDFRAGLGISLIDLTATNIKDTDRRVFEINTPFRNFSFTAESEREKEEWIEAVQESIAETLSDYEVAEKIWFNDSNRSCADCRAPQPEWASINLGVVICKKCAGQHRFLGPSLSKVRSLKLDSSIWSNELVELFLEVGNKNANSFWEASLPMEEQLHMGASPEQRATFHRRKYRERKYRRVLESLHNQEQLNQALCAAVVLPDVVETMALVFSGADVMCATGDPTHSTPYLLAQRAGQRLQMEFLHLNKLSDFPKLESSSETSFPSDAPSFMDGFLYCSAGLAKATLDRRGRDDMVRRWCTLEGGFLSYYESERTPTATGRLDITGVVSLGVNNTETMSGAGPVFMVEIYLQSDRVFLFGAKTQETQQDWVQAIAKCFVPSKVEAMLRRDCELIGRLYFKEGHDLYHWRVGWFALEGSALYFSSGKEESTQGAMQLKQLQELTVSTHVEGEERIQVLLMVEGGRTVYIHGFNKVDFALWHSAIQLAAGTDGSALSNQQLSKNGIPIVVDSCIAFVTQYGLCHQGIYRVSGDPGRVALLLGAFRQDARNVKLHVLEHQLEDVTDTLKNFLSQAEDALLAKELYPYWVSVLDEGDEKRRVEKYSRFIQSLPKINRSTLTALLQHLYRVQRCSHINQMQTRDLACVFSSCLFQTKGQTTPEISVVQDLINNYVQLFGVNEDQLKQMESENSFITRWNDKKDTTFSPAGDLIFEVYLERREPENCCLIKLSPTMRSEELAESTLVMRNVVTNPVDLWITFEVIENGELERPLHYKEKVLEQVLEWSTLDDPSSAFLVIKKFGEDKMADAFPGRKQKQFMRGEQVKFKDGSSKLLSGHKFQDRYVILRDEKLLLYKEMKSTKPEREVPLKLVKCYLGLKRKLKPPTSWGFTVYTDKQQWHFCCEGKESQIDWVTDIITMKHGGDLWSKNRDHGRPAVHKSMSAVQQSPQNTKQKNCKNPSDRKLSLNNSTPPIGEEKTSNSEECSSLQHKTAIVAKCLKQKDRLVFPETGQRKGSAGVIQPQRCPSSRPEPQAPQGGVKNPNRRPVLGGEGGLMPSNLLNELNSVLSKTGRSANEEKS
ncbi:arf-GAP with Rho-GAP domain, ANK repeat and PH domain-containing protein 2 isoform X1 [Coregonus clupeaformis]|uniref:arf-GAP with Rho-GAP domain, ANK repeat and PH domain-containing protein 2 isoform X1 n=1 Tax=Coregonus clupeaformis TaxID=59861 RepID=UPI001E1C6C8A|nr:arf-GAP with Rho-GAP domain, ANK repeat and PH domain-containing protein 2 isoform X1 [Coregonus clupeaformis]